MYLYGRLATAKAVNPSLSRKGARWGVMMESTARKLFCEEEKGAIMVNDNPLSKGGRVPRFYADNGVFKTFLICSGIS